MILTTGEGTNTLTNGTSWTGLGTSIFSIAGKGVCYNGRRFIATGQRANTIAYSTDGVNCYGAGASTFATTGNGAGANPGLGMPVVPSAMVPDDYGIPTSSQLDLVGAPLQQPDGPAGRGLVQG